MIRISVLDGEEFFSPEVIFNSSDLTEMLSSLVALKESGVIDSLPVNPEVADMLNNIILTALQTSLQSLYLMQTTKHLHGWMTDKGISDRDELEQIDKPALRDFAKALEEQSERDRLGTSESAQAYKRAQEDRVNAMFEKMMKDLFPGM